MMRFLIFLLVVLCCTVESFAWPQNLPLGDVPPNNPPATNNTQPTNNNPSTRKSCKRIRVLTFLNNVVTNQTAMDKLVSKSKFTQDQLDYLKSKKTELAAQLEALTSNSTLTAACDAMNAQRAAAKKCKKIKKLEKLVALANNQTAYNEHLAAEVLNPKQIEQLQKNLEDAQVKLQRLRSNSTLMRLCAGDIGGLQQNGAIGVGKSSRLLDLSFFLLTIDMRMLTRR